MNFRQFSEQLRQEGVLRFVHIPGYLLTDSPPFTVSSVMQRFVRAASRFLSEQSSPDSRLDPRMTVRLYSAIINSADHRWSLQFEQLNAQTGVIYISYYGYLPVFWLPWLPSHQREADRTIHPEGLRPRLAVPPHVSSETEILMGLHSTCSLMHAMSRPHIELQFNVRNNREPAIFYTHRLARAYVPPGVPLSEGLRRYSIQLPWLKYEGMEFVE